MSGMPLISAPVVFLPGTLCDERVFMPLWRELNLADRRYVPLQWANTLDEMLKLCEHSLAGQRAHVIGFSMGGHIASIFAHQHPELISSLTLIGYDPGGLDKDETRQRLGVVEAINKGQHRAMDERRLNQYVGTGPKADGAMATMQAMEADLGSNVLKCHLSATTPRAPMTKHLARLASPLQFILAEHDLVAPAERVEAACNKLPKAGKTIIANSGHMLPLEQERALAGAICDFIGR